MAVAARQKAHLRLVRDEPPETSPVEIPALSAGIKGGLAGGLAMAIMWMLQGALSGQGVWYPINLLCAGFFPAAVTGTTAELGQFQAGSFVVAVLIQLIASVVVGLLYVAILSMLSPKAVRVARFAAPLLASALLHGIVGIVNPSVDQRIDWFWFVISQAGFGVVAGIVISGALKSLPASACDLRDCPGSPASRPPLRGIPGR
jgi:hypothetical protein